YYPAFNLADSAITVGAAMLILEGLFSRRRAAS
ncbi:MAG: signal peptidase II, partial [Gammaproteobacteria bacterium]